MSQTFRAIVSLVERREVRISEHGYDELAADGILVQEIVAGVRDRSVVTCRPRDRLSPGSESVERRLSPEEVMNTRRQTKFLHEGDYAAEVEVELIDTGDEGWSPYLSLEDALKLDSIRKALRAGDLAKAQSIGRIFRLVPLGA